MITVAVISVVLESINKELGVFRSSTKDAVKSLDNSGHLRNKALWAVNYPVNFRVLVTSEAYQESWL